MSTKILKFYAPWCKPCAALAEVIENSEVDVPIESIDVDEQPNIAHQYNVRGLPTLVRLKDGVVDGVKAGMMSLQQYEAFAKG